MKNIKVMSKAKNQIKKEEEVCNECGRNVGWYSGLFVNRVILMTTQRGKKTANHFLKEIIFAENASQG